VGLEPTRPKRAPEFLFATSVQCVCRFGRERVYSSDAVRPQRIQSRENDHPASGLQPVSFSAVPLATATTTFHHLGVRPLAAGSNFIPIQFFIARDSWRSGVGTELTAYSPCQRVGWGSC